jgi:hypothetical protein
VQAEFPRLRVVLVAGNFAASVICRVERISPNKFDCPPSGMLNCSQSCRTFDRTPVTLSTYSCRYDSGDLSFQKRTPRRRRGSCSAFTGSRLLKHAWPLRSQLGRTASLITNNFFLSSRHYGRTKILCSVCASLLLYCDFTAALLSTRSTPERLYGAHDRSYYREILS